MISELISKLENKSDLSYDEMKYAMSGILEERLQNNKQ